MNPATLVKSLARPALHKLGLLHGLTWWHRNSFQILTYHRFVHVAGLDPVEALEFQCGYMREHFNLVSMSQIEQALHGHAKLPPRALAVTVDDGYCDFFTTAFPTFQAYEVPVTVYLISDFLDRALWPWWDRVEYAVLRTSKQQVDIALGPGELARRMPLQTPAERQAAYLELCGALVKVPNQIRLEFLDRLPEIFDIEIPLSAPAEYAALSWDEVRTMAEAGIEFGGHTKTHPILTSLSDDREVLREVAECKRRLEEELRAPARHFCYPNGDYNDAALAAVKSCGFLTATTVISGYDSPTTDPFLLRRRAVDPDVTDDYFRETLGGLH